MTPYEIMLSESQERMLIILKSGKEEKAKKIFKKWDLDFSVVGKTTNSKNLVLNFDKNEVANLPLSALSDDAPQYDRKWSKSNISKKKQEKNKFDKFEILDSLKKILMSPNNSEKSWVWEQYDQTVMGDTIQKSGGDAAVVRIHGKQKAVALTVDSSANYCLSNPLIGGKQVVCESWRNLISVGATPIAITNCLNFGNPENPKVMGEFAECLIGIKDACEFLGYPVVSGNVSFYNGTNKKNIHPTPVIGGVGLIVDSKNKINHLLKKEGNIILQIGKTFGHLYQSVFFTYVFKYF